jgi:hypothetical protein
MPMYVPDHFQIKEIDYDTILTDLKEVTWKHVLMIDYMFHRCDVDYDGGLSLLDRLDSKLGRFHPEWDIQEFKNKIRNISDMFDGNICSAIYEDIISKMLNDPRDVAYYGV